MRIMSEPDGAQVYIDGIIRGETPATLSLPTGKHSIFLYKKGLLPVTRVVTWETNDKPIFKETLRTQKGGLAVISDPPFAQVFLDGRLLGLAPLAFENLPLGTHEIELRSPGFTTYTRSISVDDAEPNEIRVRLEGPPVKVFLEADEGADVYLDGSFVGTVPGGTLSFPARAGAHELRVERNGFASVQMLSLEVGRDALVTQGEMHRIPGAISKQKLKLNPRWFFVAGTAGLGVAGAVVAGVGAVQANTARGEYDQAWRRRDITQAKADVRFYNRMFFAGAGVMALGAAGTWLVWPTSAAVPEVSAGPAGVRLSWRLP